MVTQDKSGAFIAAPQPHPLWNPPHPHCQKGLTQPTKIYMAGQNCFVCLIGDVGRNWNRLLFCFGRNGERYDKRPNDTARHSLNRIPAPTNPLRHGKIPLRGTACHLPRGGRLIPRPHLAGTQTALPSVPVSTKVTFAAATAPHKRNR